jgi:hypothetical protein
VIVSSVTTTWPIRFSTLIAVVRPQWYEIVLENQMPNVVGFTRAETMIPRSEFRYLALSSRPVHPKSC